MTDPNKQRPQIIEEWLTTRALGALLGITPDAVKRRIYRGVYKDVRRGLSKGGKKIWLIHVYDDSLPPEIAQLYEHQMKGAQPQCFLSIREARMLKASLDGVSPLLQKLLKELAERPK